MIREEKLTQAERLLVSFRATSPDVEAERLYHLYSIAKLRWDHESMVKIADQATTRTGGTHYAALIAGIEECIRGTCESAISDLEYANSSINNPTARGYLAAAYAYAGRHKDAEPLVDQIRPLAASVDDLLLYISVGTYLSVGRRQDAESFAADFFFSQWTSGVIRRETSGRTIEPALIHTGNNSHLILIINSRTELCA